MNNEQNRPIQPDRKGNTIRRKEIQEPGYNIQHQIYNK